MARRGTGVTSFSSGFGTPIPMAGPGDEERSDFRDVPLSDTGDGYSDRGALGSYSPREHEAWAPVSDVKCFEGFGANKADLQRGFIEPTIREIPAYDFENYRERLSQPHQADDDGTDVMADDWEFRTRNRRSRGFLTRPYIPTER